jgi:hypothetical protein
MTIREAQEEMRAVYVDGAIGPFVSGAIWLATRGCVTPRRTSLPAAASRRGRASPA